MSYTEDRPEMIEDPEYIGAVNSTYLKHGERIYHKSKRIRKRLEEYASSRITHRQRLLGMGTRSIDRTLRGIWQELLLSISNTEISNTDTDKLFRNTMSSYYYYLDLTLMSELKLSVSTLDNPRFTSRVNRALERTHRRHLQLLVSGYYRTTFMNELSRRSNK